MPHIPQINIHQTYGKIGMESKRAQVQIQQPKADITMHQEQVRVEIDHEFPQIQIDQTRAWSALGKRPSLELTKVIYGATNQIVMDTIAKIAQKGDRLAAIHIKEDPIPEMARDYSVDLFELNFEGDPSVDNVDIDVIPGKLDITWRGGTVDIKVQPNKPQIDYTLGKLDIYMRQKQGIEITVPKLDTRI